MSSDTAHAFSAAFGPASASYSSSVSQERDIERKEERVSRARKQVAMRLERMRDSNIFNRAKRREALERAKRLLDIAKEDLRDARAKRE